MTTKKLYFYINYFVFFIGLLFLIYPSSAYSIEFFANGQPRTFSDISGGDDFYGGSNLTNPAAASILQSTSLTFRTILPAPNDVDIISGGFWGTAIRGGTIKGDVILDITNTQANKVYGAGFTTANPRNPNAGAPTIIEGNVNISIKNSWISDIVGGGFDDSKQVFQNTGHTGILGNVNILLINTRVNNIYGSSQTAGLQNYERDCVFGDVNITLAGRSYAQHIIGSSDYNAHIRGDLNIYLKDTSRAQIIDCVNQATVKGNVNVELSDNASIMILNVSTIAAYNGIANILLKDSSQIFNINFGPAGASIYGGTITLKDTSSIYNINVMARVNSLKMKEAIISLENNAQINSILFSSAVGAIEEAKVIMKDNANINTIEIGSLNGNGTINNVTLELSGGKISLVNILDGINSSNLIFTPGGHSELKNVTGNNFSSIKVMKDAKTTWGIEDQRVPIGGDDIDLGGTIVIPNNSILEVTVGKRLLTNGGIFEIMDQDTSKRTEPFIYFNGELGSIVEVIKPLKVNLDASPDYLKKNKVMLAHVTTNLANPNLFSSSNRIGLIWNSVFFDNSSNIWYLNNFEVSKDYYGYLSARSASSWLRQRHLEMIQTRPRQALLNKHDGLWVNIQGGHEKIGISTGNSKMLWVMTSAGYDYQHEINENFTAIYGGALGFNFGDSKWTLYNTVKNKITTGLLSGYVGLSLNSGFYGIGAVQLSSSSVKSKNQGFFTTNNWKEIVPTESLELGWNFTPYNQLTITPRIQTVLEHIPKKSASFTCLTDNEKVTFNKTTALTTTLGLITAYNFEVLSVHIGVDWIKSMSGEYAVHSQFFDMKFKEKNNSNVIRTSLGCDIPLMKNMHINTNLFVELNDNKGFGLQASYSYTF